MGCARPCKLSWRLDRKGSGYRYERGFHYGTRAVMAQERQPIWPLSIAGCWDQGVEVTVTREPGGTVLGRTDSEPPFRRSRT